MVPARLCGRQFYLVSVIVVFVCHIKHVSGELHAGTEGNFTLTVLHTNDVHARFDEATATGAICRNSSATKCYGGVARRATAIKRMRERFGPNVLLLDAGDQFQGTLWFYVHRGAAALHFMNRLQYDAMALGNHEFDNGIDGLVPFLRNTSFPVLCSNVNTTLEPALSSHVNSSVVVQVGGQKVGIVGYLTTETPILSETGRLTFEDEVAAIQREVNRLQASKVNKIIALGHAGFNTDKKIAADVVGVDLVIGGHTNTFLHTGDHPAEDMPEGPYPVVVTQPATGRHVPVVQAFAFGKYLGVIHLTFNGNGEVISWTGNPLLLNESINQDSGIVEELSAWRAPIQHMYTSVVGSTATALDGRFESCRMHECTMGSRGCPCRIQLREYSKMPPSGDTTITSFPACKQPHYLANGNMIGDAMVDFYHQEKSSHKDLQIAILNGGSIRASIDQGDISYADVMESMPFGITIDVVELSGHDLLSVFEHSVEDYDPCNRHGKFLQVSGVRVTYDLRHPNGRRVSDLQVRLRDNEYGQVEPETIYKVGVSSFLVRGGDGYQMIHNKLRKHYNLGIVDADIAVNYLRRNSPLNVTTEGRIQFIAQTTTACSSYSSVAQVSRAPRHGNNLSIVTSLMVIFLICRHIERRVLRY